MGAVGRVERLDLDVDVDFYVGAHVDCRALPGRRRSPSRTRARLGAPWVSCSDDPPEPAATEQLEDLRAELESA
jgi:hypothetical protein